MEPTTRLTRRNVVLVALAILVFLLARQLFIVLTTGKIVVTTNDKANIVTLREIHSPDKQTKTGNTSFRVAAGTYIVTVTGNQLSSQEVVSVKVRETKKVSLNLKAMIAIGVEPASSREARSLVVGTAAASFIDATNNNTYSVGQAGNETLIDSDHSFKTISWADPTFGVGKDKNNQLQLINNSQVQALTLPNGFRADSDTISFAVSPNRTIVISDGSRVYSANYGSSYTVAYTSKSTDSISVLYAQNGSVLLLQTPTQVDPNNHGDSDELGGYVLVDKTGKAYTHEGNSYESVLSPDGQHVALSGNAGTAIYDNHFQKVIDIPTSNVIAVTWINTHTVLYTFNSQLWQYDMNAGKATMLTDVSDKGPINTITASRDGQYVYFLIQNKDNSSAFNLYRIALDGQPPLSLMVKLGVFLPNVVDACSLGYENFTQPTVVVHGPADMQSDCIASATNYLQLYKVSDTGLNIVFSPGA